MGDFLELSPSELRFRFELRKNVPVTLSLSNTTEERVAFKVKTTSPKKYCVRPSTGFVDPGATKDVQVILQASREPPPSLSECKDKFLVQSLKISSDMTNITPDLFEAGAGKVIKQSKLRVVLVGPPKPPSPVPEGIEEESTPIRNVFSENNSASGQQAAAHNDPNSELATITRERNRLRDQLNKVQNDKEEIKRRLDTISQNDTRGPSQAGNGGLLSGNFRIVHMLAAILISLLVGLCF